MAGRPQAYLGRIEDALIESQSTGWELISSDLRELALHDAIAAMHTQAEMQITDGDTDGAKASLASAGELMTRLRRLDLAENAHHKALVRVAA